MTTAIVQWDSVDTTTQRRIEGYYRELWGDSVVSLIREDTSIQDGIKRAFSLSKHRHKQNGLDFGFVKLVWGCHPEKDCTSLITIEAGTIDPSIDGDPDYQNAINSIASHVVSCELNGLIPIFSVHGDPAKKHSNGVIVFYKDELNENQLLRVDKMPFYCISTFADPCLFEEIKQRESSRKQATEKKQQIPLEKVKEDELYDWLRLHGVNIERQVKTSSKQFVDLWVPGKMMIEIKRGNVTANDVCQCIDYAAEYRLPIILIGEKITGNASRGLAGFNKLCKKQKIFYVSWDVAYDFLRGKLIDRQLNLGE